MQVIIDRKFILDSLPDYIPKNLLTIKYSNNVWTIKFLPYLESDYYVFIKIVEEYSNDEKNYKICRISGNKEGYLGNIFSQTEEYFVKLNTDNTSECKAQLQSTIHSVYKSLYRI